MSQKNSLYRIKKICMNALKNGMEEAGDMNGISKGRVSVIFNENKHLIFLEHEYSEDDDFSELQRKFKKL